MLDHRAVVLALRARLLSVTVADTGATTLGTTGNGFTRTEGSFIDDGFTVGLEVVPTNFPDSTPTVIKTVSPLEITVADEIEADDPFANRRLHVGIPALREWENMELTPIDGRWYISEDYLPGPTSKRNVGQNSFLDHYPTYVLRLVGLAGNGVTALYKVSGAILAAFPPSLALEMPDGNHIRVRGEPAPYPGQLMTGDEAGRAGIAMTFPLWAQTVNSL